eukprot:6187593-Pleurochrysis_carterae.AAC.1
MNQNKHCDHAHVYSSSVHVGQSRSHDMLRHLHQRIFHGHALETRRKLCTFIVTLTTRSLNFTHCTG